MVPPHNSLVIKAIPDFERVPVGANRIGCTLFATLSTMSNNLRISTDQPNSSQSPLLLATTPLAGERSEKDTRAGFVHHTYMTVAWRTIFENVLPMLSMASSILSTGPTSIKRTWSASWSIRQLRADNCNQRLQPCVALERATIASNRKYRRPAIYSRSSPLIGDPRQLDHASGDKRLVLRGGGA